MRLVSAEAELYVFCCFLLCGGVSGWRATWFAGVMNRRHLCIACWLSVLGVVGTAHAQTDAGVSEAGIEDEAILVPAPQVVALAPTEDEVELAAIRAALDAVGGFDDVQVDAQAGVIRLRGSVHAVSARGVAEEIVTAIAHPVYVANGISVLEGAPQPEEGLPGDDTDEALAAQIRTILATVDELGDVRVTVGSGVVHLRGSTAYRDAKDHAVEIASELDGVLYVDDDVVIDTNVWRELRASWRGLVARSAELVGELPRFGVGLLVLALAVLLARGASRWRLIGRAFSENSLVQNVARRLISMFVLALGSVLALDVMGATALVGAVLGTAGIVGLALGFAFKDIAENYLAGILLAVSRPFAPKDHVLLGAFEGKVIRLTARETILMTLDGNHVQIPNATVFSQAVLNYSRNPLRRFDFTVGIGNDEDLAAAQKLAFEALGAMEGVMKDPCQFTRLDAFDDSSMSLHVYGWVDQTHYDFGMVKSEAIRQVKRTLDEHGVDLPNPITQVLVQYVEPKARKSDVSESSVPAQDLSVDRVIEKQINADTHEGEDLLKEAKGEPDAKKAAAP